MKKIAKTHCYAAHSKHYSLSFGPGSRCPSSRRLRSTSFPKSSSNCASRSLRISTRNDSGKRRLDSQSSNCSRKRGPQLRDATRPD